MVDYWSHHGSYIPVSCKQLLKDVIFFPLPIQTPNCTIIVHGTLAQSIHPQYLSVNNVLGIKIALTRDLDIQNDWNTQSSQDYVYGICAECWLILSRAGICWQRVWFSLLHIPLLSFYSFKSTDHIETIFGNKNIITLTESHDQYFWMCGVKPPWH